MDSENVTVVDAGRGSTLLEFLTIENINKIDLLIISHADADHIGGVISLLSSRKILVNKVHLNTNSEQGSKIWDDLLHELGSRDILRVGLSTNNCFHFGHDPVNVEVIFPNPYLAGRGPGSTDRNGRRLTGNSTSAVIRINLDGNPIALLPSDIDNVGLDNLIESGVDASAPINLFPHHGGRPGVDDPAEFTRRFCLTVNPDIVIFSIGRGQHSTPREEIVNAIREEIPDVRILCTQLSEHCASEIPNEEPSHLTDCFSRGQEHNACCAGTIVIHLDDSLTISPAYDTHIAYIVKNIPQALCLKSLSSPTNSL